MPVELWPSWQQACRPFFRAYAAASGSAEANSMFQALLALVKIPASSLLRARGGHKKRRAIRSLLAGLRSTASRSVDSVASHQAQTTVIPVAASDSVGDGMARARALIQQGHVGRAARSLFQAPLPPIDAKIIEELHSLHPPPSGPVPPLPAEAPLIQQVDLVVLARLVRTTLANGAAPGGSGWTVI
jgi:microcompartment protein CcmK/EutM